MIPLKRTPTFIFQVAFFAALVMLSFIALPVHTSDLCFADTTASETAESFGPKTLQQKVERYHELVEAMRDQIRVITKAKLRYYLDGVEASYDWKDKWEAAVSAIEPLRKEFEILSTDLFLNNADDEGVPDSLPDTMFAILPKLLETDHNADTISTARRLLKIQPENSQVKMDLGLVLLRTNQFAEANKIIDSIPRTDIEKVAGADNKLVKVRKQLESYYEEEKEIIAAETAADDLPRVELLTTQGPIVVELFENEAPDTVGNFIHLVEDGFYKDMIFHRVLAGFMAQVGSVVRLPDGYVSKEPGYTIYDEAKDGRRHYSGYLSMAKTSEPNTANGQFFITFAPTNYLDGRHTVFGRVIEGLENVGRIKPTFEEKETEKDKPPEEVPLNEPNPDRIIDAKVIRKRDHDYVPNKVTPN
ncbi:peptidylprolyl isomerase [bacterium]|nr:peptidylprolyl isomerase [bacterium]